MHVEIDLFELDVDKINLKNYNFIRKIYPKKLGL